MSGDVFTVVINGTSISYTATGTTVASVTAGLKTAIDVSAVNTVVNTTISGTTLTVATKPGTAGLTSITATAANGSVSASSATVITNANVNATGVASNVSVLANRSSANVAGQIMTTATATLGTPTLTTSSLASQFVLGGSTSESAQYNFIATNGDVTLDKVSFKVTAADGATSNNTIYSITVNGKTVYVVNSVATISGLGYVIPAGYSGKTLSVTVNYNNVGDTSAAVTSNSVSKLTLTGFEYLSGNDRTVSGTVAVAANDMNVVNAIPSVALTADSRSGLISSSVKLADVTVSASSTGGAIKLEQLPITVTSTGTVGIVTQDVVVKDASGNTISGVTGSLTVGAGASGSVSIVFGTPYAIAARESKVFSIYATASVSATTSTSTLTTSLGAKGSFKFTDVESDTSDIPGTPIYNYSTNTSSIHN